MKLKALFMFVAFGMASGSEAKDFSQTPLPVPIENFSGHTPQHIQLVNHWCRHHPWECRHHDPHRVPVPLPDAYDDYRGHKILRKEAHHCRHHPYTAECKRFCSHHWHICHPR